jgi:hypothetical protein
MAVQHEGVILVGKESPQQTCIHTLILSCGRKEEKQEVSKFIQLCQSGKSTTLKHKQHLASGNMGGVGVYI